MGKSSIYAVACWAMVAAISGSPQQAQADLILAGPGVPYSGGGNTSWGIEFTANQNSVLTGFDFNHRNSGFGDPFFGNITLNGTTIASYPIDAPGVVTFSGLSIGLIAGHTYDLVVTPQTNTQYPASYDELFNYIGYGGAPAYGDPSYTNENITVTSGVADGILQAHERYAFSNIATAVPEPSTFVIASLGIVGLAISFHRRRRNTGA